MWIPERDILKANSCFECFTETYLKRHYSLHSLHYLASNWCLWTNDSKMLKSGKISFLDSILRQQQKVIYPLLLKLRWQVTIYSYCLTLIYQWAGKCLLYHCEKWFSCTQDVNAQTVFLLHASRVSAWCCYHNESSHTKGHNADSGCCEKTLSLLLFSHVAPAYRHCFSCDLQPTRQSTRASEVGEGCECDCW